MKIQIPDSGGKVNGLIITDLFPPDPGGRSEKMYRHIKYFNRQGINVDVLCPSTTIASASYPIEGFKSTCHRVRPFWAEHLASLKWQENFMAQSVLGTLWLKLKLPSGYIRWILPAYIKACSLIRRNAITFIVGVSNPIATQLICILLKMSFRKICYVAELRDPVTGYYRSRHSNFVNKIIESCIVRMADCIVEWKDFTQFPVCRKYPFVTSSSIFIDNVGYDPDDYRKFQSIISYNKSLNIIYTGGYYGEKDLWEILFIAIKKLIEKGLKIKIHYYGDWDKVQDALYKEINKNGSRWLKVYGRVPKNHCITACMKANATLYILDNNNENMKRISSKIYDYFACKRPILAIVPEDSLVETKIKSYDDRFILTIPVGIPINKKTSVIKLMDILENLYETFLEKKLADGICYDESLYSCLEGENIFVKTIINHVTRQTK